MKQMFLCAPLTKGEPLPQYVAASIPQGERLKFNPRTFTNTSLRGGEASARIPASADVACAAGLRGQVVYAASWP